MQNSQQGAATAATGATVTPVGGTVGFPPHTLTGPAGGGAGSTQPPPAAVPVPYPTPEQSTGAQPAQTFPPHTVPTPAPAPPQGKPTPAAPAHMQGLTPGRVLENVGYSIAGAVGERLIFKALGLAWGRFAQTAPGKAVCDMFARLSPSAAPQAETPAPAEPADGDAPPVCTDQPDGVAITPDGAAPDLPTVDGGGVAGEPEPPTSSPGGEPMPEPDPVPAPTPEPEPDPVPDIPDIPDIPLDFNRQGDTPGA